MGLDERFHETAHIKIRHSGTRALAREPGIHRPAQADGDMDSGFAPHAGRACPTCASNVPISGKPEIGGGAPRNDASYDSDFESAAQVVRFRSSHHIAAPTFANFGI